MRETTMAKVNTSGYDCSFVTPLSSDLQSECTICLQVLREPYLVSCCGYRFCRTCIEPIQGRAYGRRCPMCNAKDYTSLQDRQLERILNDKFVRCAHSSDGCKWTGKLATLESHLEPGKANKSSGCKFTKTDCYYCKQPFLRSSIGAHAKVCTSRFVTCQYCNTHTDTARKLESQHYGECPMFPVPCPNGCGSKPFRKNLPKHVDNTCPQALVECTYRMLGCDVRLPRREMSSHEDVSEHILMGALKIDALKEEVASLKQKLETKDRELRAYDVKLKEKEPQAVKSGKGKSLKVTNLPHCANKQMLKCVFGQHGSVKDIKMNVFGLQSAQVEYEDEHSMEVCLSNSRRKGIKLKSVRLSINPEYLKVTIVIKTWS